MIWYCVIVADGYTRRNDRGHFIFVRRDFNLASLGEEEGLAGSIISDVLDKA
jgi:hypothetical protein